MTRKLSTIEIIRHLAQRAARQQLERGFGAVIGIAQIFALLDVFQQARDARILGVEIDAHFGQPRQQIGAARLVRDQNLARVADRFRRHMLIGARVLQHRRGMQPALVREGRRPDIGRVAVRARG